MPRFDNDRFYDESIARYGYGAKGVHWKDERSQRVRFDTLLSLIPDPLDTLSLADAGCGSGALWNYLNERKTLPAHYFGLEIKPEFVTAAKKNGCPVRICNILYDTLPKADWYLASGAMNILTREESKRFITRCFNAARRGFVFNLLEGKETDSLLYNYWQIDEILDFCRTFPANTRIKRGYLRGDFTIALLRN